MKKTIVLAFALVFVLAMVSCKEQAVTPADNSSVPTPITTGFVVDNFDDSDLNNLQGGVWYTYDDRIFGGGNTASACSFNTGASGSGKSLFIYPNNWGLNTFVSDQPAGYYGFFGICTTFTAATNLSSLSGIRFKIRKGGQPTNGEDKISVWLGSQQEYDNNINSHYRAWVSIPSDYSTWREISIPWVDFNLGYVYDSGYPAHAQTFNQVLKDVIRIGFDKSYHYATATLPPSSYSQFIEIDDVEIY